MSGAIRDTGRPAMTCYTNESRWRRFWRIAFFGTYGAFMLLAGFIKLVGPTEGSDLPRHAAESGRVFGAIFSIIAISIFVRVIGDARRPCAVEIRPDGTVAIIRLLRRKKISIRSIGAIEWHRRTHTITIKHGRHTTAIRHFPHPERFVADIERLCPSVVLCSG
jgi:hypothetical protein